jgi:hypothetical protein
MQPKPPNLKKNDERQQKPPLRVCPVCGGELIEIRAKLQCPRCHTICETCCEGGRG